jgi:uncharacterized protein YndB with AHSA1/START domain
MPNDMIARAEVTIDATAAKVWDALVNPAAITQYMFGTTVVSEWREGSPIVWKGEWKGNAYEDKGVIRRFKPGRALQYTHFSPLAGLPDAPENYHTVSIELSEDGPPTLVALTQDNNPTDAACAESVQNWTTMLAGLKKFVEQ